jgi:hypothetical protein
MMQVRPIRARRGERGEVSWVGLLFLLSIAAAAYLAVAWVPVYVRKQQVEEIVRSQANSAVKNLDEAYLVADLARRVRALETVEVEDPDGRRVRVPLIDLNPQDITWERNTETRTLHVAFTYTLEAVYPWIGRTQPYAVDVDITADVALPDWGNK